MKRLFCVIPLVCLICFAFGCQDKAAMADLEKFKAQAAVEEQNKASFRYMIEETDKGNYAAWDEVCSADYVSHWGEISWNLEEHKQANRPLLVAFPDLKHEINNMIAKADRVVVRVTLTGTHEGEYMGIPLTCPRSMYQPLIELFKPFGLRRWRLVILVQLYIAPLPHPGCADQFTAHISMDSARSSLF